MRIFLVGLPGVGKTHYGKKLSQILKCAHIDLDEEIENMEGINVSQIFKEKGEAHFRQLETTTLKKVCQKNNSIVLSVGGGLLMDLENLHFIKKHGVTIYLKRPLTEIVENIKREPEKRPLFAGQTEQEIVSNIKTVLQLRRSNYEQTHIITGVEAFQNPQLLTNRIELFTNRGVSLIDIVENN